MRKKVNLLIIHRYLARECSPEEKAEVESWIADSEENRVFFESVKKIWEIKPVDMLQVNTEQAWQQLEARLKDDSDLSETLERMAGPSQAEHDRGLRVVSRRETFRRKYRESAIQVFLRVAAVLLIATGLGISAFLIYDALNPEKQDARLADVGEPVVFEAVYGKNRELRLPDGTQVVLNAGSRLEVRSDLHDEIYQVSLNGEAYFNVSSRKERTFRVTTDHAKVEVLGTRFNVSSWEELNQSEIVVENGRVTVASLAAEYHTVGHRLVKKNQRVVVRKGEQPSEVDNVDHRIYFAWLHGGMNFEDAPLSHVFLYLERRFNVNIEVEYEDIKERRVNARYLDETLEEILEITTVTHDLDFHMDGDRIVVEPLYW